MHETLAPLMIRALEGTPRPLEFYLCEQSHLPGPRANLALVDDVSHLLVSLAREEPEKVRKLVRYLITGNGQTASSNTPDEFVMLCGIVSLGACASIHAGWRQETYEMLANYACSTLWRVR